ncbi:MAG: amidohydrolase/deacetylase family metallohydrolase [Candidatus Latescibacteria bacterium]|jgi:dihydroorotase|nr:amidohydrolase/deacetylase family metallohydrolase [Candidatus Latescibacterota bacterium]
MSAAYDLVLKGGHVIDPKNEVDGVADVAIADGKIAAVGADLPDGANQSVDVSGLYVTPGLVDIHVHVYGGFRAWVFPDPNCLPDGVTTVLDAGSPGWKDLETFRTTIVEGSITRVLALVNIVGAGMVGKPEQDTSEMVPEACAEAVRAHREFILGVKSAHFQGPGWESAGGAIEAARLSDTFVMVDFAEKPTRTYKELLERLGPGDMHTHMYGRHNSLLDEDDKVNDYVWAARERGVIFDTGHGSGSFLFRNAKPALDQGFPPDTISTDLHQNSRLVPNATMLPTMSKYLNLGMPLQEIVLRSSSRPAELIGRPDLGHLSVGSGADVAVFDLQEGDFGFVDTGRNRMDGTQRLVGQITLREGKVVWDLNGRTFPDYREG